MKKRFLFAASVMTLSGGLASCGQTQSDTSKPKEGLIVEDMLHVYYENGEQKINYRFADEGESERITYEYSSPFFKIENDNIVPLEEGDDLTTVKAKTSKYETEFKVHYRTIGAAERYAKAKAYGVDIVGKTDKDTCVYLGDSFFDVTNFWKTFYQEVGGNRYICGISASKMEEWFVYAREIFKNAKPKSMVFHLGGNDLYDQTTTLEDMEEVFTSFTKTLHEYCPESKLYFFSVLPRNHTIPGTSYMEETVALIKEYNSFVSNCAKNCDYMTYLDNYDSFCNEDGTRNIALTKDGTHPKNETYPFYVEPAIEAGISEIQLVK